MQRPYYKQPRQYTTQPRQDTRRAELKAAALGAIATLACITAFMLIAFT